MSQNSSSSIKRSICLHHTVVGQTSLQIHAIGAKTQGNGQRRYDITGFDATHHPMMDYSQPPLTRLSIPLQSGDPAKIGQDGVIMEALIAIVVDQLQNFQAGQWPCSENAEALDHFKKGLAALHRRTERDVAGLPDPAPGLVFDRMVQAGVVDSASCPVIKAKVPKTITLGNTVVPENDWTNLDFSQAFAFLKAGYRVRQSSWDEEFNIGLDEIGLLNPSTLKEDMWEVVKDTK